MSKKIDTPNFESDSAKVKIRMNRQIYNKQADNIVLNAIHFFNSRGIKAGDKINPADIRMNISKNDTFQSYIYISKKNYHFILLCILQFG